MLAKAAGKDTETVINGLIENAYKLPQKLYKSLAWERTQEMVAGGCGISNPNRTAALRLFSGHALGEPIQALSTLWCRFLRKLSYANALQPNQADPEQAPEDNQLNLFNF